MMYLVSSSLEPQISQRFLLVISFVSDFKQDNSPLVLGNGSFKSKRPSLLSILSHYHSDTHTYTHTHKHNHTHTHTHTHRHTHTHTHTHSPFPVFFLHMHFMPCFLMTAKR